MIALWKRFSNWFLARILASIQSDDLLEMKRVTTEKVTLNSVLLHNEMVLHNRLWLSFTVLRLRGDLYNEQQIKVGWIDLAEPIRVRGRGKAEMVVETHLSHITAFFNVFRFMVKDNIPLQLSGKVWLKVLWLDFSLPISKTLYIHRDMVSYVAKTASKQQPTLRDIPEPSVITVSPEEGKEIVLAPPPPPPLDVLPVEVVKRQKKVQDMPTDQALINDQILSFNADTPSPDTAEKN